jgi:hypothetical protein
VAPTARRREQARRRRIRSLIRVAVTRDPSQAIPVDGSFIGDPQSFIAMEVQVTVTLVAMFNPLVRSSKTFA